MSTLFRVDMQIVSTHGHAGKRGHATRPFRGSGFARPAQACKWNKERQNCRLYKHPRQMFVMSYQFARDPLNAEETERLVNACSPFQEKLIVGVLLDTGLRVREFCGLRRDHVQWQENCLVVWGKGGWYGHKGKRRLTELVELTDPICHDYW